MKVKVFKKDKDITLVSINDLPELITETGLINGHGGYFTAKNNKIIIQLLNK